MSVTPPRRHEGIEGRWAMLMEERDQLREEKAALTGDVERLRRKVARLEAVEVMPEQERLALYEELRRKVDVLTVALSQEEVQMTSDLLRPNEDEEEAFDAIQGFMRVMHRLKLKANQQEMYSAIHVLQGFVVQHMLERLVPGAWGEWFGDDERKD
jgi:hypothetical protein